MKLVLHSVVCFITLSSIASAEDFKPRSSDFEKTKMGVATATVVLVGNDEPWLEIHLPIVESDHDGRTTHADQVKLVRIPVHRAVAWNANGVRLRDELIAQAFREPKSVYVDDLLVQSKRVILKKVYVNERVQFGRFDEYRKFQRDGVRDPRFDMKMPPVGSFDTGDYFVSFECPADPEIRTNSIWLFLPPEVLEEENSFAFPSAAILEAAMQSQRIWQDQSGRFKVSAQVSEYDDENVKLRKADGTLVTVPIAKLSFEDRKLVIYALRKRLLSSETPRTNGYASAKK